jgi:hypothetical protein
MYQGYLIDAERREVRAVEYTYTGPQGISALIGADLCCLYWNFRTTGDVCFVDDTGFFKPLRAGFRFRSRPDRQPVPGNGLVTGPDDVTGTSPPVMTLALLVAELEFMSAEEIRDWLRSKGDEPAVKINGETVQTWAQMAREAGHL